MKRMNESLVLACLAFAFVIAGCGKSSDQSGGGAENKSPLDAIKVKQILDGNLPLLTSDNKDERVKAAQALGELGDQGKKAIPDLVARMGDASEDSEVTQAAREALGKVTAPSIADALAANFAAMSAYKNEGDSLRADLIKAQDDAKASDDEVKKITLERDALANEKLTFDKQLADKDAALKTATDALRAANTAQAKVQVDLAKASDQITVQKQEIDKLNNQIKDMEAKAAAAGDLSQKANTELQAVKAQLDDAKAKLDAAMQAVNAKDAEIAQLKKQIDDLKAKIAQLQATPAPSPPPAPAPAPAPAPTPAPAPAPSTP
jgi:DNA repair exonuclease SbcCD ATPase subunit